MVESDMNEGDYNLEKVLELGLELRGRAEVTILAGAVIEWQEGDIIGFSTPGTRGKEGIKDSTSISGRVVAPLSSSPFYAARYEGQDEKYMILEIGNPAIIFYRIEYGSVANVEKLYTAEEAQGKYHLYAQGIDEKPKEDDNGR